jgi:hypothetical protein
VDVHINRLKSISMTIVLAAIVTLAVNTSQIQAFAKDEIVNQSVTVRVIFPSTESVGDFRVTATNLNTGESFNNEDTDSPNDRPTHDFHYDIGAYNNDVLKVCVFVYNYTAGGDNICRSQTIGNELISYFEFNIPDHAISRNR